MAAIQQHLPILTRSLYPSLSLLEHFLVQPRLGGLGSHQAREGESKGGLFPSGNFRLHIKYSPCGDGLWTFGRPLDRAVESQDGLEDQGEIVRGFRGGGRKRDWEYFPTD